jgi:TPR repeat protein
MTLNPSHGYSPQPDSGANLVFPKQGTAELLNLLNSEEPSDRELVRQYLLKRPETLPREFLEEAAFSAKHLSIAQALLSSAPHMSYLARLALAEKFHAIGRDDGVMWCLAHSELHDAHGLRFLCQSSARGRFLGNSDVDIAASFYAAGLGDLSAEIEWIQRYGRSASKGRDFDRCVQRLMELANEGQNPQAFTTLGEMLIAKDLACDLPDMALHCFRRAAVLGYAPGKLNLLTHLPEENYGYIEKYFTDFYNESYFPGMAWCYSQLQSEDRPLRHIDEILKAYLWHPEYPIRSREEISRAVEAAEGLSDEACSAVAQWALRKKILVMDGRYPAVTKE